MAIHQADRLGRLALGPYFTSITENQSIVEVIKILDILYMLDVSRHWPGQLPGHTQPSPRACY